MTRTGLCLALSLTLVSPALAQGSALATCGRIDGAAEGIFASVTTLGFADGRLDPHEPVMIGACLPDAAGLNGRKCGTVFETVASDLLAGQWIGPVHLLIETASLRQSGLQLVLEIQRSGLDLASRVSIVPIQRLEPNAQRYIGARETFDSAACSAAPPPISTVPAQAD